MNRRSRALPVRAALLCALLVAISVALSSAAPALRSLPASIAAMLPGSKTTRQSLSARLNPAAGSVLRLPAAAMPGQRPFVDLRRVVPSGGASIQQVGQIGSTNDIPRQAVNHTTFPRPPQIGTTTVSDDIHPAWSPDEAWIYFASNRSNVNGTAVGANYHIWRMSSDGTRVEQVTGTVGEEVNRDQLYPTVAPNGLIAFSERAGAGSISNIIVLDIRDPRTRIRTPVTGSGTDPRYALGDALQPSWSPSSEALALAANKEGIYNIYTINLRLGDVRRLTNGTAANGIDSQNPDWSPGGTLIAFDSNAADAPDATGLLTGTAPKRNIYVSYVSGPNTAGPNGANTQKIRKMTIFPNADHVEPAFSQKVGGNFPNDTNNRRLLAFAAQRADTDGDGRAETATETYNLFWINSDDGRDLPNTSNARPEAANNLAQPIITQDTDPTLPAAQQNRTNERYPSFPPFIRSIRVAYQSNATGNNDIWTASFVDASAPSLEAVNLGSGEILRVAREGEASPAPSSIGRREFVAGDRVVLMARARDLQSGIRLAEVDGEQVPTIYLQIRDPDGKFQDADGKEHKTYFRQDDAPGNPIPPIFIREDYFVQIPQEESSQVIDWRDPSGRTYSHPWYPNVEQLPPPPPPEEPMDPPCPEPPDMFKVNAPTYIPATDDVRAWSGKRAEPRPDWMPLYDDGPAPNGHEPAGQVAGDGVFSNLWQTPPIPSDYILDVITYDRAIDPLARGPGENWKIWDNVWGFTTQPFIVQNPILAVMDYPEGQRFLATPGAGRFSSSSTGPVESYLLDLDEKLYPKTMPPEDPLACPPEEVEPIISGSYGAQLGPFNTLGSFAFRNNRYDLWRVICRGPVDRSVLLSYTPTEVEQVDPQAFNQAPSPTGRYPTIRVPAAEKAVYWASPYTGDLWVGRGTLTDAFIQSLLTEFVLERGGRLFVTGQDVGWALTLNGSLQNTFFRDVLKAEYVQDGGVNEDSWKLEGNTEGDIADDWPNRDLASPLGPRIEQIPPDPYREVTQTRAPDTLYILTHGTDRVATDGAKNQAFPDHVRPLTGSNAKSAYRYTDGLGDGAIYSVHPRGGRVVYLSFGLESVLREYDSGEGAQIALNFRSKLLHNALCWATTGQIRGRVVDVQGLRPVAGAVVRALPDPANKDGAVVRTAVTDANGNYVIRGLVPQPSYDIEASVPGFTSQHLDALSVHGLEPVSLGDLIVSRAAPGSISGLVRNQNGQPVPGAVVLAKLTTAEGYLGQVDFAASTNAAGQFRFGDLPIGSYTLRIDPAFLQTSGYNGAQPGQISAGVQAGRDAPGNDFTLGGGGSPDPDPGPGPGPGPDPGTGIRTFQPGLHLISTPYDYPGDDAAALLGLQPADLDQKLAVYMNDSGGFKIYSDPAARNLRLGRGYFVRLSKPAAITKTGTPAPTDRPYSLALSTGWNLIGNPFLSSVRWSDVQVQAAGQNAVPVAQAIQQGSLRPGLLTLGGQPYRDSSTLEPWTGYWVRTTRPVTLLIPPPATSTTSALGPQTLPKWDPKRHGTPPVLK